MGILNDTLGAETGVTTTDVTFDDVINLYMSVKAKHRKHGVWLMNDETALALRKLKDKDGMPLVAMHWEHRFNSMVGRYNEIYKMQIPNITPHVCRHTYCSNQAKAGMNPKTLQYLMGHSDIAVTLNVYTHVGLEDAENELRKMQTLEGARKEMGLSDKDDKPLKQTMFKVV